MKDPKLKDFTYSHYLKVTTIFEGSSIPAGVKLVLQGAWYRITHDGLIRTFCGETYDKGWKEKPALNKEESKESHGPSGPNVDKQYAWPDDVEDDCYHMEEIH